MLSPPRRSDTTTATRIAMVATARRRLSLGPSEPFRSMAMLRPRLAHRLALAKPPGVGADVERRAGHEAGTVEAVGVAAFPRQPTESAVVMEGVCHLQLDLDAAQAPRMACSACTHARPPRHCRCRASALRSGHGRGVGLFATFRPRQQDRTRAIPQDSSRKCARHMRIEWAPLDNTHVKDIARTNDKGIPDITSSDQNNPSL